MAPFVCASAQVGIRTDAVPRTAPTTMNANLPAGFKWFCLRTVNTASILLHRELGRAYQLLLRDVVVHLDVQQISTRLQRPERHALFQRDLLAIAPKLLGGLRALHHGFVCLRVDDLVLEGSVRLLRLVVDAEVIDLHPEVHLLVALERSWFA